MCPNQPQQNSLIQGELEHENENGHKETPLSGNSSNENISLMPTMTEEIHPGLKEGTGYQNDKSTGIPEGTNVGDTANVSTVADIQQSRDAVLQQDSPFVVRDDDVDDVGANLFDPTPFIPMEFEKKEENASPEAMLRNNICNDTKPTHEANADTALHPHPKGAHGESDADLRGDVMEPNWKKFNNMTTDPKSLPHNEETQESVNIRSPQKLSEDELPSEGHVKNTIPLFENATPQKDLDNVKNTPAGPRHFIESPKLNSLPKEGTIFTSSPSGAGDSNEQVHEISGLNGGIMDRNSSEEFRNMPEVSEISHGIKEKDDAVCIQSPQKPFEDDLKCCKEGYVKEIIPLFLNTTPQEDLDNVKYPSPSTSPFIRNPRPTGLQQEENISISCPSDNVLPDRMNNDFQQAVNTNGPGADDSSEHASKMFSSYGDVMNRNSCDEFRNVITVVEILPRNKEREDAVNIQSPQKTFEDELQCCKQGHVKATIPLFSNTTPHNDRDRVNNPAASISPLIGNPRPAGHQKEEKISISNPNDNMFPDRMNKDCHKVQNTMGHGASGSSEHMPKKSSALYGDDMASTCREDFRNRTTFSGGLPRNRDIQGGANIQSPQKPSQSELLQSRDGYVKDMTELFSNTTPQKEQDNTKIPPENTSMSQDSMSKDFHQARKTKRPGAGDSSEHMSDDEVKLQEFLRMVSEKDLQVITTQFKEKLKGAVEEFGQQLVLALLSKQLISQKDCEHARKLLKEKCKNEASTFIFDQVRVTGFEAVKMMWEICVNTKGVTPKLNEIRNDLIKKVDEANLNEFLRNGSENDFQVITKYYRNSLEDAVEEFGPQLVVALLSKQLISDKESEHMRKLIHEMSKSDVFQLILDKVTVNGIEAMRKMWETCLKLSAEAPTLSKIRNDLLKHETFRAHTSPKR
ncbi:uncharacterized protein LOC125449506 isoform X2 [Stegostoma tigrinum]|uniref:uncharacterized protein LOC125449506 isoform X2 n=1 Tax=Stegostoma tigrinum TaxID=3053191 RepID=UPI0028704E74|nr:uncharacterized protein LOC125449506 isoform X2 [Stegostoma tigrinum]